MWRLKIATVLLLFCTQILSHRRDFYGGRSQYGSHSRFEERQEQRVTKEIRTKQGRLKGMVIRPPTYHDLQYVDVFLGIPYAEPPEGPLRFSPPQSPKSWRGVRQFQQFAPVCPQVLPNLEEVKSARYEYLQRILPYLENQSEDCLYLNIYSPHQVEGEKTTKKRPVIVFIHGESYEWNSGNPYDGTIFAAYGNVVFVTINYRLGIVGFLRPGIKDDTSSNFGLLDQIAAFVWIRDNIAEFGGDASSVTIMGHGTGAIFANLLLISPIASKQDLFKRAILMSGSALNPDAIAKAPLQITKQVAHALNCPTSSDDKLAACLRDRDIQELLNVKIHKPKYVPAFATLVDTAVMPDKPIRLMENSPNFGRYDLLYGVTELEKFHIVPLVSLLHGLLDEQRDQMLRDHIQATHELEPETILSKVLEHYGDFSNGYDDDYVKKNRNMVLEVISDSSTVAPLLLTANLHARLNSNSYMYVFTYGKLMKDYTGDKFQRAAYGEELPFVLGAPLNKDKYQSFGQYDKKEILFSEAIMNWWCNFAETGNPNGPRHLGSMSGKSHLTGGPNDWSKYETYWPQYDPEDQTYFNLTIPPETGSNYKHEEITFWNEKIPDLFKYPNSEAPAENTAVISPRGPRPVILDIADGLGSRFNNITMNLNALPAKPTYPGMIRGNPTDPNKSKIRVATNSTALDENKNATVFLTNADTNNLKSTSAISMVIGFGVIFLIVNISAFVYFYFKRRNFKPNQDYPLKNSSYKDDTKRRIKVENYPGLHPDITYKSESKPDLNDLIKNDKAYDNNSNFGRRSKHSRRNSTSTIDTHIKVREWIQQEIVQRCSPRFLRKTRETLQKEHRDKLTKQQVEDEKNIQQKNVKKAEDSIYEDNPTIIVRPGKPSKLQKVSVAVDATPATRTESVLKQIPIELTKDMGSKVSDRNSMYLQLLPPENIYSHTNTQVVIEHHHSKSDPLPMDSVYKIMKQNQSHSRIYESDSGSSCSLYAKVTPKNKSKVPALPRTPEVKNDNEPDEGNIYEKIAVPPTFVTFGANNNRDINVTSKDPTHELERVVSHEEALKTIKRRNYPKVLPDLERRRSLPVKSCSTSFNKQESTNASKYAPLPPPRMVGTSGNLSFSEEFEDKENAVTAVTNLHVGPLIARSESSDIKSGNTIVRRERPESVAINKARNNVASADRNSILTVASSADTRLNPEPLSRSFNSFLPQTQASNVTKSISSDTLNRSCEPNWFRNMNTNTLSRSVDLGGAKARFKPTAETIVDGAAVSNAAQSQGNLTLQNVQPEPVKIVITPRIGTNAENNRSDSAFARPKNENEASVVTKNGDSINVESTVNNLMRQNRDLSQMSVATLPKQAKHVLMQDRSNVRNVAAKHPKIIIKPTTMSLQRNRNRHVPKVSAIPSPEKQNFQNDKKDHIISTSSNNLPWQETSDVDSKTASTCSENIMSGHEAMALPCRAGGDDEDNGDIDSKTINVLQRRLL